MHARSSPSPPSRRRALGAAWACFCAAAASAGIVAVAVACTSPEPRAFDGSSLGACTGAYAKEIPASRCTGCTGSSAYALCNGDTFNVCTCDVPGDYSTDAGLVDTGAGPELRGFVALDADILATICCTGKIVYELPASDCPARCKGETAYAVCVDDAFTACACDIPPGYSFSDLMCDAGDY
jgi:hypothetical protein